MTVGLIGPAGRTARLAGELRGAGVRVADGPGGDVVVVAGPPGERMVIAGQAAERGAHIFLAWPPGVSAHEAEALSRLAEEAGVDVGVARPLAAPALLAAREAVGPARLVTLSLVAAEPAVASGAGPGASGLGSVPWPHRIAGALDLCAALVASHDPARLDAEAERDGGALRAVVLGLRFRNGAYAQATLRASAHAPADEVALYAAGPGGRAEARQLDGPLCVDGHAGLSSPPMDGEALGFVRAVAVGRRAPYGLDEALATLRLAERVMDRLR